MPKKSAANKPTTKRVSKQKPPAPIPSDDIDGQIAREAEDRGELAADRFQGLTIEGTAVVITPSVVEDPAKPPLATETAGQTEAGKIVDSAGAAAFPGPELLPEASRARKLGEKKHDYWERMRKAARLAGLARGQGPGTAYVWATEQTDREFPPPEPVIVEELPVEEPQPEPVPASVAVAPAPTADDQGVSGLGSLPANWPELPANAQLQVEIAWVTANRLRVRSGTGVDLSKALSPAPSYSALSWLETSILFPAKFADISVKATADNDDEKEFIRREKLAIEEIRSILAEMLEAGDV